MPHSTPIVFVVDDDASLRGSLGSLICSAGWQPKMFGSAEEFLDYPHAVVPTCLVLELSLPGLDGLDLQKRAAIECPHMPVIFITDRTDVHSTVQAMKAGALEFLTKPLNNEVLLSAIQQGLERSRVDLEHLAEIEALQDRYSSLSSREREVMALVVSGRLNKQAAGELGISEVTVKAHRGKVMQKMDADSLADLVKMAGKLGLAQFRM
jgi:FixJ family two-component response regulator